MSSARADLAAAWSRVLFDCGCPDLYFCPAAGEVECPRHSGFAVCCDRVGEHVPVAAELRSVDPRPGPTYDDSAPA